MTCQSQLTGAQRNRQTSKNLLTDHFSAANSVPLFNAQVLNTLKKVPFARRYLT